MTTLNASRTYFNNLISILIYPCCKVPFLYRTKDSFDNLFFNRIAIMDVIMEMPVSIIGGAAFIL